MPAAGKKFRRFLLVEGLRNDLVIKAGEKILMNFVCRMA